MLSASGTPKQSRLDVIQVSEKAGVSAECPEKRKVISRNRAEQVVRLGSSVV